MEFCSSEIATDPTPDKKQPKDTVTSVSTFATQPTLSTNAEEVKTESNEDNEDLADTSKVNLFCAIDVEMIPQNSDSLLHAFRVEWLGVSNWYNKLIRDHHLLVLHGFLISN